MIKYRHRVTTLFLTNIILYDIIFASQWHRWFLFIFQIDRILDTQSMAISKNVQLHLV